VVRSALFSAKVLATDRICSKLRVSRRRQWRDCGPHVSGRRDLAVVSHPRRDNFCKFNVSVVFPENQQVRNNISIAKDRFQIGYACNLLSACDRVVFFGIWMIVRKIRW
jgi:hypothetical protein